MHQVMYLYYVSVDRAPSKVVWYAFWKKRVPEYLVQGILYSGFSFKTTVSADSEVSDFFFAQFGVH